MAYIDEGEGDPIDISHTASFYLNKFLFCKRLFAENGGYVCFVFHVCNNFILQSNDADIRQKIRYLKIFYETYSLSSG